MRVNPTTIDLDREERLQIARYWDAVEGNPWGEDWEDAEVEGRLATYDECRRYVDDLIDASVSLQEVKESADQQEGAM